MAVAELVAVGLQLRNGVAEGVGRQQRSGVAVAEWCGNSGAVWQQRSGVAIAEWGGNSGVGGL